MVIHVVAPGDTIYSIAAQYGVSVFKLIQYNQLKNPDQLVVGQTIVILFPNQTHVVVPGDTLFSIARQYNVSVNTLYRNNPEVATNPTLINGQVLVISFTQQKVDTVEINAYAYPFIDKTLLRQTVFYLTYLVPFSYGFTPEGNLVPLDDEELLRIAGQYRISSLMHLSTLTLGGGFSNELSTALFANPTAQTTLIENILTTLQTKGYAGIDVDFEYVRADEANAYAAFITKLRERLNPEGYLVTVALAPKTFATQKGLLYEGHNYALLGEAADAVLLMTYEWGYTYHHIRLRQRDSIQPKQELRFRLSDSLKRSSCFHRDHIYQQM